MFKYKKITLVALLITVPVLTVEVFAQQSFFDSKSNTKKTNQSGGVKVLTPEEFSSVVKTAGQDNQSQLQQKASEAATKMLPPPPKVTPGQATHPAPASSTSTKPSAPTPIEATPAETEAPPAAAASPAPAAPVPEQPAAAPAPAATSTSTSSSPSSQPYTGFGNSGNATQGSAPAQQSGGGWNIKY